MLELHNELQTTTEPQELRKVDLVDSGSGPFVPGLGKAEVTVGIWA